MAGSDGAMIIDWFFGTINLFTSVVDWFFGAINWLNNSSVDWFFGAINWFAIKLYCA
jgi:hypothetical protein